MGNTEKDYMEKLEEVASLLLKHDKEYAKEIIMSYIYEYWDESEMARAERYLTKIDSVSSSAFDKEV